MKAIEQYVQKMFLMKPNERMIILIKTINTNFLYFLSINYVKIYAGYRWVHSCGTVHCAVNQTWPRTTCKQYSDKIDFPIYSS